MAKGNYPQVRLQTLTVDNKSSAHFRVRLFFVLALAFLITVPSISMFFVSEDLRWISLSRSGSISSFFTTNIGGNSGEGGLFRPLTKISFFMDNAIWGVRPFGYHLSNMLFNLMAVGLFFLLSVKIFSGRAIPALFSAFFFISHSSHPYAVYWISARADLICAVFYFGWMILNLEYLEKKKWSHLLFAGLSLLFALFSKEMAVSALLVAPILFIIRREFLSGRIAILSFLLSTILPLGFYFVIRAIALGNPFSSGEEYPSWNLSALPVNLVKIVGFLLFPFGHGFAENILGKNIIIYFIIGIIILSSLFIILYRAFKKNKRILYFILIIIFSIIPVVFNPMRWQMYLPSGFLSIALGAIIFGDSITARKTMLAGFILLAFAIGYAIETGRWIMSSNMNRYLVRSAIETIEMHPECEKYYLVGLPSKLHNTPTFTNGFDVAVNILGENKAEIMDIAPAVHKRGYESLEYFFNDDKINAIFQTKNSFFRPRFEAKKFGEGHSESIAGALVTAESTDHKGNLLAISIDLESALSEKENCILIYHEGRWDFISNIYRSIKNSDEPSK